MLTLERIAKLRACFLPTRDEQEALLDAAEAWELLAWRRPWARGVNNKIARWHCDQGGELYLSLEESDPPTPQAAVLAALGKKGGGDAPKEEGR